MTQEDTMTDTHAPAGTPLVELRDIKVSFGGLHAVDGVSMALHPGEVMAVVGGTKYMRLVTEAAAPR